MRMTAWNIVKGRAKFLRKSIKATFSADRSECPLCGHRGLFIHSGTPPVMDSGCPSCGSAPRQRLLALFQDRNQLIEPNREILHFAAEASLLPMILRTDPERYVTADIKSGFDLKLNIEQIDLPSASFDCVLCLHVLEHVDDKQALAEINRILRPNGILIAMVPIIEGWDKTYENPAIIDWRSRKRHFGGGTHVRFYGRDFRDRIRDAGFAQVDEYTGTPEDDLRYALTRGERIFLAIKR
jgi:SAM-dependent methyltransferase